MVRCVAHGDKGPSMSLTRNGDLRAVCFSCGFRGDVFALVAAARGMVLPRDFAAVAREAAELAALPLPALPIASEAPPPADDATFHAIAEALFAHVRLWPIPRDAARYLIDRRLAGQARRDGWEALPPAPRQDDAVRALLRAFPEADLIASGLFTPQTDCGGLRFVRPGARILIPWRGPDGRILSLQRRRLDAHEPRYVAPAGRPLTHPYGCATLRATDVPIAYVEGAADVLALRELARRRRFAVDVLGIPGVQAWRPTWARYAKDRKAFVAVDNEPEPTEEERAALKAQGKRPTRDVVEEAAERMAEDLRNAGAVKAVRWRPRLKDWGKDLEAL